MVCIQPYNAILLRRNPGLVYSYGTVRDPSSIALEGGEMVPMWEPPTAKIETWRKMSGEEKLKALGEIRRFAFDLGLQLKNWCELY